MTKTTTAVISVSLLLLGGSSIYLIQRNAPQATARVEPPPANRTIPDSTGETRSSGTTTRAVTDATTLSAEMVIYSSPYDVW